MKNNKGFTLIELIATIAVLGIIMLIAIPNITSIVDNNKRTTYLNDSKKLVSMAKYRFNLSPQLHPGSGGCIIYYLNNLDKTEFGNSPTDGGIYFEDYSYVKIVYEDSKYTFYVQLIEEYIANSKIYFRGVKLTNSNLLSKETAKMEYVTAPTDLSQFTAPNSTCQNGT